MAYHPTVKIGNRNILGTSSTAQVVLRSVMIYTLLSTLITTTTIADALAIGLLLVLQLS